MFILCSAPCPLECDGQPPGERRCVYWGWEPNGDGTVHVRPPGHGHAHWREGNDHNPKLSCGVLEGWHWKSILCNFPADWHPHHDAAPLWGVGPLPDGAHQRQRPRLLHRPREQAARHRCLSRQDGCKVLLLADWVFSSSSFRETMKVNSSSVFALLLQGRPHICRQLSYCRATGDRVCGVQHWRLVRSQCLNHGQRPEGQSWSCGRGEVRRCLYSSAGTARLCV